MKSWEERLRETMIQKGYTDRSQFTLEELLALAKDHTMTPEEYHAQRVSFAYGNLAFSNSAVTREDIERAAKKFPPFLRVVK